MPMPWRIVHIVKCGFLAIERIAKVNVCHNVDPPPQAAMAQAGIVDGRVAPREDRRLQRNVTSKRLVSLYSRTSSTRNAPYLLRDLSLAARQSGVAANGLGLLEKRPNTGWLFKDLTEDF